MRYVLISSMVYPVRTRGRYGGVERLVGLLAAEMAKKHQICVVCTEGSALARTVERVEAQPPSSDFSEPGLLPALSPWMGSGHLPGKRWAEGFLDFSHSKSLGRAAPETKQISFIWHDPAQMQPPQPHRNVAALSSWQAQRFEQFYKQEARVLDPICADPDFYHPEGEKTDRLVWVGKLHPTKGALVAAQVCRALRLKLDIVGPVTPGDPPEYAQAVMNECDGEDIVYLGEVDDEAKRTLLRRSRAIIYFPQYDEAHSQKLVEAFLCGTPAVVLSRAAMGEVVVEGATGVPLQSPYELQEGLKICDELSAENVSAAALQRWSVAAAVERIQPTLDAVAAEHENW